MSHQSGITANLELLEFLPQCRDGQYRLLQVKCANEELTLCQKVESSGGDWDAEYDALVTPCLMNGEPCYIMYRLDSHNQQGFEWLFLTWIPNNAHVREKMLYASTRASFKRIFGDSLIKEEILGHHQEDLTLAGYTAHLKSKHAPKPLTQAEEEMEDIRKNELRQTALGGGQQTITGTNFRLTNSTQDAIQRFAEQELDYVQLRLNVEEETIELADTAAQLSADRLNEHISQDLPGYHIFRYRHEFDGDSLAPTTFLYTFVGYKVPVKQRMLYSSCKSPFIQQVEQIVGSALERKLEVDATDKHSSETFMHLFHPQEVATDNKIEKPKGPGRRGNRRLV